MQMIITVLSCNSNLFVFKSHIDLLSLVWFIILVPKSIKNKSFIFKCFISNRRINRILFSFVFKSAHGNCTFSYCSENTLKKFFLLCFLHHRVILNNFLLHIWEIWQFTKHLILFHLISFSLLKYFIITISHLPLHRPQISSPSWIIILLKINHLPLQIRIITNRYILCWLPLILFIIGLCL